MKYLLIILISILLAFCGQSKKGSSSNATVDPLAGDWKGSCHDSSINLYNYDGSNRKITIQIFSDALCQHITAYYESHSTYTISGTENIDYTIKDILFTVTDQTTADYYSQTNVFGFSTWEVNTPRNVEGLYFDPAKKDEAEKMPPRGQKVYSIYEVSGNTMTVGDFTNESGDTPATRPKSFDPYPFSRSL
jgi:hypothetical protein